MTDSKRVLISAGIMTLLASALLFRYTAELKREMGYDQMVSLLSARAALPSGTVLNAGLLQGTPVPARFAHPGAVKGSEVDLVLGRKVSSRLAAGQVLLWSDVSGGKRGPDRLSDVVPMQQRALTIPVNPRMALAGMVQPGDRVDVLLTWSTAADQRTTRTVLQNLRVTAVGGKLVDSGVSQDKTVESTRQANSVTLLVSPADAELLVYIVDRGDIALTLRSPGDQDERPIPARDFMDLLGEVKSTARMVPPQGAPLGRLPEVIDLLIRQGGGRP